MVPPRPRLLIHPTGPRVSIHGGMHLFDRGVRSMRTRGVILELRAAGCRGAVDCQGPAAWLRLIWIFASSHCDDGAALMAGSARGTLQINTSDPCRCYWTPVFPPACFVPLVHGGSNFFEKGTTIPFSSWSPSFWCGACSGTLAWSTHRRPDAPGAGGAGRVDATVAAARPRKSATIHPCPRA